ncbi:poly [ADP-ribose] polymerase 1-like [Microplitis mediator]|uniref:poly [ADP-ribose] polymerase 1-like n=1 Tax=Microplitis mediator TaxID=375433 RepID=UPI002557416C|nr:poly [ADP-ribose] polymerase 1-like [Microplitis mediator]
MDLTRRIESLTINDRNPPNGDNISGESLKRWIEGCEKLKPDPKVLNVTNIYRSNVKEYSVVFIKTSARNHIHYYKLEILKHKTENKYWLFRSWGTVVTVHGDDLLQELPRKECIRKYKWIVKTHHKRDFDTLQVKLRNNVNSNTTSNFESKLPVSVQNLMKLIFNADNISKVMEDYNLQKIRPGQLSENKIQKAYGKLKMISRALNSPANDPIRISIIIECSTSFYACIPHQININELPMLDNPEIIASKFDMLDELFEINLADKIMNYKTVELRSILDIYYDRLNTDISELNMNSNEFKVIKKYIENTHSYVHDKYKINIEKVFAINRKEEAQRYANRSRGIGNKMLLWHGTKLTNIASILLKGLRIPRKNSTATTHMFGRGIYFADVVSKSANYCRAQGKNSKGLLLLCEVALGNVEEKFQADNDFVLPKRKHSVIARGRNVPDPEDCGEISPGVKVPFGKIKKQQCNDIKPKLIHNEYVVYDTAQIKIKYLVQINFDNEPCHERI